MKHKCAYAHCNKRARVRVDLGLDGHVVTQLVCGEHYVEVENQGRRKFWVVVKAEVLAPGD